MRPLVDRAVEEFRRLPKEEHVKHCWVWVDKTQCTMIKYDRPKWMDTARSKYRGGAFSRGASENGAPTSNRRVSGRSINDVFGAPAPTGGTSGSGGADPFGAGII